MPEFIFTEEPWMQKLFDALERVERGQLKRLMVSMPPRTGKTEIIGNIFTSWYLGRSSNKKVMYTSYGYDLSEKASRRARQICKSQEFKNVFPNFRMADDKSESANWETLERGGYYARGVGGGITGSGFHLGIVDDPHKDRMEAESVVSRGRVLDWYKSTFFTRRDPRDNAIIIIMTRWHDEDLAGTLLKEAHENEWEQIVIPAVTDEKFTSFFPERFSTEMLIETHHKIGEREWQSLYMQDPLKSMGAIFKKEDFRYFAMSDFEKNGGYKKDDFTLGIFIDPATSTRDDSDDTVIAVIGKNKLNQLFVFDLIADTLLPSQAIDTIYSIARKWKNAGYNMRTISCEEVFINRDQQFFVNSLESEMRARGEYYMFERYHPPRGNGKDRIRIILEPRFSLHDIFFRCDDTGNMAWRKMEEQLLKFPLASHDDLPDALAQGAEVLNKISVTQTEEKRYTNNVKLFNNLSSL